MADIGQILTGIGGIIGGGGIVAWRKSKVDAGKLALDIAREADTKAQSAIDRLDEMHRRVLAHFRWDVTAMQEINRLGGSIGEPTPLLPPN